MTNNKTFKQSPLSKTSESDGLYQDACIIIEQAQATAYRAVNEILIKRNWLLGLRIQHEVLKHKRAEYGEKIVKDLANALTCQYGKGFTWRNLYNFMDFFQKHNDFFHIKSSEILHAVSAKSTVESTINILHATSAKSQKNADSNISTSFFEKT